MLATLGERSAAQQRSVVRRAHARAPAETLAAVIRTAQDYARTDEHPALLWLDELAETAGDPGALVALVDQLPQQTTSLRGRAAALQGTIVALLRSVPEDARGEGWPDQLAGALNNLGIRLSALGRREEALAAAQEAVALRRELAAARPDAFRPDLAVSLYNLAGNLEDMDRGEEALAANAEAVAALSEPFCASPQAFAHWMGPMVRLYLGRCEKLGREPDGELLAPVIEVLQTMRGEDGG